MKYMMQCMVTVSAYTEVEAFSEAEALEIANAREVEIGGNGSGQYPDEVWVIEEADGSPESIRIDEVLS